MLRFTHISITLMWLFVGVAAPAGCRTVPETGRKQFVLLSQSEERVLGEAAYAQQLEQATVLKVGPQYERVQRVGARIAEASRRRYGKAVAKFEWEFSVFDTPDVNAWMLPGGKSAVFTGLLRLAESDDELAIVMGHEVAHAIARHGAERLSRAIAAESIATAASEFGEVDPEVIELAAIAYGLVGETAFSRNEESEADTIGLLLAAEAGYDPRAALTFWKKMSADADSAPPEFLSTHPSDETRVKRLTKKMPEAMKLYEASRGRSP